MQNSSFSFQTLETTFWARWSLATISLSPQVSTTGLTLSLYMVWIREVPCVKLRHWGPFPPLQLNFAYPDSNSLIKLRSASSSFPGFLQTYSDRICHHLTTSSELSEWGISSVRRLVFSAITRRLPLHDSLWSSWWQHLPCETHFICHARPWCRVCYCQLHLFPEIPWLWLPWRPLLLDLCMPLGQLPPVSFSDTFPFSLCVFLSILSSSHVLSYSAFQPSPGVHSL